MRRRIRSVATFAALLSVCAAFFGAPAVQAEPTVVGYELVSSTRVDRTRFDYRYRVRVQNAAPAYTNASFTVTSSVASTQVIEAVVAMGEVPANTSSLSTDTFTIRQDRLVAVNLAALAWRFSGVALPAGSLLNGDPGAPAAAALTDYWISSSYSPENIDVDDFGTSIVRTELRLRLAPGATIGGVNAALIAALGRITSMSFGGEYLVVALADPGSTSALTDVGLALLASGQFDRVLPSSVRRPAELPSGQLIVNPSLQSNHLAVRAPAAWNVLDNPPAGFSPQTLVIEDWFGLGSPLSRLGVIGEPSDFVDRGALGPLIDIKDNTNLSRHGYHVAGIAVSAFDDDEVVGAAGGTTLALRVNDLTNEESPANTDAHTLRIIAESARQGGRVVLNNSNGWPVSCIARLVNGGYSQCLLQDAEAWAVQVAKHGLQGRFLHVVAAGNHTGTHFQNGVALRALHIANGIIVENVGTREENGTFVPDCRAADSIPGGVAAIGEDVLSYTDDDGSVDWMRGTSMAAPQVAGIAAMLWSLRPDLAVNQIQSAIIDTARPSDCSNPTLDAYAAVLALDRMGNSGSSIRRAILDVTRNGVFDETDISAFASAWNQTPGVADYGRHDLNGDGFTGGSRTARFDLNTDGNHNSVRVPVNPNNVSLDENMVSDAEVLCYYAFAWLALTGSQREMLRTQFPGVAACDGTQSEPLSIELFLVRVLSWSGQATGEFTSTNGSDRFGYRTETIPSSAPIIPEQYRDSWNGLSYVPDLAFASAAMVCRLGDGRWVASSSSREELRPSYLAACFVDPLARSVVYNIAITESGVLTRTTQFTESSSQQCSGLAGGRNDMPFDRSATGSDDVRYQQVVNLSSGRGTYTYSQRMTRLVRDVLRSPPGTVWSLQDESLNVSGIGTATYELMSLGIFTVESESEATSLCDN